MTPSQPRPHLVRLAAVLVFIGLPALLLALSLVNVLQFASDGDALRERAIQSAALERRLGQTGLRHSGSDNRNAEPPLFIEGTSRTAAIAALQQDLLDAVSGADGQILETAATDQAVSEGQDDDRIAVKTTLDIDNDGLLRLLYGLESGVPLIDVTSLSIRRLPDGADETNAFMLRLDMTIRARWKAATMAGGS